MYSDRMARKLAVEKTLPIHQLIADFLAVSSPLEAFLQQRKPLTNLELQSITLTVDGLQDFLAAWTRNNG
jgi:hypothetical protein